jgi:Rieske 2Fe-2S family protein
VDHRRETRQTPPSHYYRYLDTHKLEKRRIFYKAWLCAGRASQVPKPGDYSVVTVGDESILSVRDRGRKINAFYNVWRHLGTRLCVLEVGIFRIAP